ncbi:MAG: hypothetical protein K0M40_21565 [Prolixibacteraceae bacterium]|nr:hypothetical protein [Prolixibacteraceae bacterium]
MRKYSIVLILLIFGLYGGLISCNKTDSTENSLVGVWESTKVDSLIQYVIPAKPNVSRSVDYKEYSFEFNIDGAFKMRDSKDTINGSWVQSKSDSLMLTVNNVQGNYPLNSKIEFIDNNNLILNYSGGYVSSALFVGGSGLSVIEEIKYDIKVHYIKK